MNNYLNDRLEANKKAIGKTYHVLTYRGSYLAEIIEALPEDRFIAKSCETGEERNVSIWNLRGYDEQLEIV